MDLSKLAKRVAVWRPVPEVPEELRVGVPGGLKSLLLLLLLLLKNLRLFPFKFKFTAVDDEKFPLAFDDPVDDKSRDDEFLGGNFGEFRGELDWECGGAPPAVLISCESLTLERTFSYLK